MKNYSYVTLLTNDSYVYGVALLVESMKRVNTQYPLHVLIIDEVAEATIEILKQLKVTYEKVDIIPTPEDIYEHNKKRDPGTAVVWRNCWTKFRIFDQTQFDKIIFLDADIMILQNLDHLFELPHMTAAMDGEYFGLWPTWPHFNSGCLVIEPSHQLFEDILNFASSLNEDNIPDYVIADQEVLNLYYKDWPKQTELHLNKYYNIFPPYVQEEMLPDLENKIYFAHFVGRKPWVFWLKNEDEIYSEHYYALGKEMVEARIRQFDWDAIHSKLVLSVYAICKNEIKNIDKWLKCFSEADNICVLDTGSTDGTWEFLNSQKSVYPNLIIDQQIITPWRFDKARNLSLALVPKNTAIYFMVDIDEIIKEPNWAQRVKNAWDPLFDRGVYTYNRDVDETNDTVIRAIPEFRLHSPIWDHYQNIVHEAIINKFGQKMFFMETCTPVDIVVWHYPTKTTKTDYMELCERDLEEYPDDWVMHLQLAIEYEIREEFQKAYDHFLLIITSTNVDLQAHEIARCYTGIGCIESMRGNYGKAHQFFMEGRLFCPYFGDNYLADAQLYFNQGFYNEAINLCSLSLKQCTRAVWCNMFDVKSYLPYYLLALSYYNLKDKIKALAYITVACIYSNTNEMKNIQREIAAELYQESQGIFPPNTIG